MSGSVVSAPILTDPRAAFDFVTGLWASSTECSLVAADADGVVTVWNEGAARAYGRPASVVVGRVSLADLHDTQAGSMGLDAALGVAAAEGRWAGSLIGVRGSGDRFTAHVILTSLGGVVDGRPGFLMVAKDGSTDARISEQLRAVEQRARAMVESNPDALVIVERDGLISDVNRQMVALTGRGQREDLLGTPFAGWFTDAARVEAALRRVPVDGSTVDWDFAVPHSDGTQTVVSCSAAVLPEPGVPVPGKVLVVVRDVTEQRRAVETQRQLAELVESSHDAIMSTTADGVISTWNPGAERLYGYTASEIIGRGVDMLAPADARPTLRETLRRIVAGERVDPYEAERLRKDGRLVPVSVAVSPIMDVTGRIVGAASTSRDLSDRTMGTATFRGLLEMAPDAILGISSSGSIELVNAQCERLFGYDRDELVGQLVEVLVPDDVRAGHVDHRARYNRDPTPRSMGEGLELAALRKDGTEIPVEISLSVLETATGTLTMAAVRDVTERRRFERQLRDQNVELERASRAKDNFLASMSHELRTPLNAIIGFAGTLLMKLPGPLNGEQEHQLQLIRTSGNHLLSIINDLLDLAKIESGRVEITLEPVDCRRVAEEVVQSLQPLAAGRKVTLVLDTPEVPVVARSDRRALGQILINLTNNAIKFTDAGEVRVTLIASAGSDDPVRIAVRDTGSGIPDADLDRIFRAFERSATTAKAADEGTGLGLHISQKLAELLSATVSVTSTVGQGSTFTIAVPRAVAGPR